MTDHALYRFFDEANELLYIGITANVGARLKQHSGDKPWWTDVHHITLTHYANREDVLAAEMAAIIDEHPRHNVVYNRNRPLKAAPLPQIVQAIQPEDFRVWMHEKHPQMHGPWPKYKPKPCPACGELREGRTTIIRAGGRMDIVHLHCREEWERNHPKPPPERERDYLNDRRLAILRGDIA